MVDRPWRPAAKGGVEVLAGPLPAAPRHPLKLCRSHPFGVRTMSVIETQAGPSRVGMLDRPPIVNDFAIVAATVNGSGSQTANNMLMRAIFKMGIPVSGKNLFPSNIAGLPTWYTIRVSKDGYIARREGTEILVALNPKTADEDIDGAARRRRLFLRRRHQVRPARATMSPTTRMPVKDLAQAGQSAAQAERLRRQHGLRRRAGRAARHRDGRDRRRARLPLPAARPRRSS